MRTISARIALEVFLFSGASLLPALAATDWQIPPGVKTVKVNGYSMAYIKSGAGLPIVILHGTWVDHRFFAPQVCE